MQIELAGVYLLYDHDELVDIGPSKNIIARVGSHAAASEKHFTHFAVLKPKDPEDRFAIESFLIKTLQPKYNSKQTKAKTTVSAAKAVEELLPVLTEEIKNTRVFHKETEEFKRMRDSDFRSVLNRLFPWWTAPPSVFKEALKEEGWIIEHDGNGVRFRIEKFKEGE